MPFLATFSYILATEGGDLIKFLEGDALSVLKTLEPESVNCCVTSPPYWGLRDYGIDGQLGLEKTPEEYTAKLVEIFREVRRVLKKDGTLWLNLGDSIVSKQLIGVPWRVAFALQSDGWYLRQDIIWAKPDAMPEPVKDRCTKSHEYIFLMSKKPKYYFDYESIKEQSTGRAPGNKSHKFTDLQEKYRTARGLAKYSMQPGGYKCQAPSDKRNKRSVWTIAKFKYKGAHFATFPPKLIEPCILAGCPEGGVILDPFSGAGSTALMSAILNRDAIGIELNPEYIKLAKARIYEERPLALA